MSRTTKPPREAGASPEAFGGATQDESTRTDDTRQRFDQFAWQNALVDDDEVSKSAKFVGLVLLRFVRPDGRCWPTITTIADRAKVTRATARAGIDELVSQGWLERNPYRRDDGAISYWWKLEPRSKDDRGHGQKTTEGTSKVAPWSEQKETEATVKRRPQTDQENRPRTEDGWSGFDAWVADSFQQAGVRRPAIAHVQALQMRCADYGLERAKLYVLETLGNLQGQDAGKIHRALLKYVDERMPRTPASCTVTSAEPRSITAEEDRRAMYETWGSAEVLP